MVHQDRLSRRTEKGLRLVPDIPTRYIILQGMHDDIGDWEFKSTYEFIASRLWWPNIRSEVSNFVRICDVCQRTKPDNREKFQGRIPLSGLFNTWSVDFAGPLPKTKSGNQYLLVGIEHMSKWPVARARPGWITRMDNTIFSRASNDTERVSVCVSGTNISAQPTQMGRRRAMTRVIAVLSAGIVEGLPPSSIPGMMSESLRIGWPKWKKSERECEKRWVVADALW